MRAIYLTVSLAVMLALSASAHAGSWKNESLNGMNVHVYTPTTTPARNAKRALMINLHGCSQTATDLKNGGNWVATADKYGMVVAIPDAPNGGVIIGCWDYYGSSQSRGSKFNDNVIGLANTLKGRGSLNIDANQVYVSGLSSGASQAMVLGCLAPDIFSGVGINAGPTIGTSSGQIGSVATDKNSAVNLCNSWAGSNKSKFSSQITSVIYGTSDYLVAQGYAQLNIDVMKGVGNPKTWLKSVSGMGHAWPAGGGSGGNYIDNSRYNYPNGLTDWLCKNNPRAGGTCSPSGSSGGGDTGGGDTGGGDTGGGNSGSSLYCGTATNEVHHNKGRAVKYGSGTWASFGAKGSYQWLGYATASVRLKETSAGYFVKASSCP